MFLVLIPVIVPFFQSYGLTMSQIFQLQAIFGFSVVLFEVPTGYVSDLFGRKRSMVLGAIFSCIGFLGFALGKTFFHFAITEFILAIGLCFVSGTDQALLYDSLPKEDRKRTSTAFANMQFSSQLGESIASLLGGFLATLSLAFAAWGNFLSSVVLLIVSLTIEEEKRALPSSKKHKENFSKIIHAVFFKDKILRLSFINSIVWGLSTFFAVWTYQKHWQEIGIPLAMFGVIWAVYNLTTGFVGKSVYNIEKKFGAVKVLMLMALLSSAGYFLLGLVPGAIAVCFALCHYVSRGINGVIMNDAINWRLDSEFRATIGSLSSFCFRLGFAIFGPVVGYSIDRFSLSTTYIALGFVFLAAVPVFLMPLIREIQKSGAQEIRAKA